MVMVYLTDGVHLYEVTARIENYGIGGGAYLSVADCVTGTVRRLSPLETALCDRVTHV
jgi:hypothetical protein